MILILVYAKLEEWLRMPLEFWPKNGDRNDNFDCENSVQFAYFLRTRVNEQDFDLQPREFEENIGRAFNNTQRDPRRATNIAFATQENFVSYFNSNSNVTRDGVGTI
nr:unnamed protein product [Callosobruchus chinensis]